MTQLTQTIARATQSVRDKTGLVIDTAVVLGSGLSDLEIDGFEKQVSINYSDIDGLPRSTAPSHKGELHILQGGSRTIAVCAGRQHLYEGYTAQEVCTLSYLMRALGAHTVVITNAAGALNPEYLPGDVMLMQDHINFTGLNPLIGQDDALGMRFPDMSEAYSRELINQVQSIDSLDFKIHRGVYIGVTGPSLETSAERQMLRAMGADAVGMSTVLEVIAANHCGMNVLGLSAITNLAIGDENQAPDTIEEVLENAAVAGQKIMAILRAVLA